MTTGRTAYGKSQGTRPPELAARLSDAQCNEKIKAENRAVQVHRRHILAVIEGRGDSGEGNLWNHESDSRWVGALDEEATL
jgi:hypothetical protein